MSHNLPQTILQTEHKMSVEEVCRKYNTDCVQVRMGGARAGCWGLGLREEGSGLLMGACFDLGCQGFSGKVSI